MKDLTIWLKLTSNSLQQTLSNKFLVGVFLTGKILRVALFLVFLNFLLSGTNGIGGYSKNQVIFFYLSFNLIDTLAQLFFREVYRFRALVISGELDFVLVKPFNPLTRVLLGGVDVLDLIMLMLIITIVVWFGLNFISTNPVNWLTYILMIINGFVIAASLHIFILGFGIITTTVDHLIMVYRDLSSLLRIPVDLYQEPVKSFFIFVIPLGVMMTFPAKTLMGLLSLQSVLFSFLIACVFLVLSYRFFNYCLKFYQSAS